MPLNDCFEIVGALKVERVVPRGESSFYYICWRPNISAFANDSKEVIRFARWPASTPTGAALRQWLKALPEAVEPEPNDNTKTII